MRFSFVLAVFFALSSSLVAQVSVKSEPADVKTRTFDPRKPPAEMPKLQGNEAAVTESKYACGVQIEVEITPQESGKAVVKITGVTADLTLKVIMWLPNNASAKIKAHEAGHKDISLAFFKNADETAKKIAEKYVGKDATADGTDKSQTTPIIQRWANEYCGEYLGATEVPGEKVQKKYDELTDHGRNRLTEAEAIKRAMAK